MSEIVIDAPAIDTRDFFRPGVVRTILPKLSKAKGSYADFLGGSLLVLRVRKEYDGYVIEYREDNSGVRYCSQEPLTRRKTEKALISYGKGSDTWNEPIEFSLQRDFSNRIGYSIGRIFRPIGDFIRGFKIGYEKTKNN